MVRIISFVLLIFASQLSYGNSRLQLMANSTETELGKPLQITIVASNVGKDLASINIDKLTNDFGVYVIESSSKTSKNNVDIQELKIALYPHRIGGIEIPSVTLGDYSTSPLTVSIVPADEDNQVVTFNTSISSLSIWQRQQIILTTSVLTHSKFAKIKLDDFIHKGIESYKLEFSREDLGDGRFRLTAGWVLYPLITGKQNITFPAVNYRLKGKVQRKFIPQNIELNVRALPPYIPPLMPVGEITVDKLIAIGSSDIDKSHTLSVTISSHAVLPSTLPGLPRDYIVDKEIITGEISSTPITNLQNNKFSSSIHHHLPVSFNTSGRYDFSELVFKYFEPNSGKIITIRGEPQSILILSPWLKVILTIILVIIFFRIIAIVINHTRHFFQLRGTRKIIIKSTLAAESPEELHCLLNEYARTYNWGCNITLANWLVIWGENRNSSAKDALNTLSRACYSGIWDRGTQSELNKKIYLLLTT